MEQRSPIRVAQIVGKVVAGGVDVLIMNYYRNLDRQNIQFDFIMDGLEETPLDEEILSLGGRVYKVPHYTDGILKNMLHCYMIFKENQYKIVHSNLNSLNIFPLAAAWLAGVKIRISHSHSTSCKSDGVKTFVKMFLRLFSRVFATHYYACSEQAGRWLFGNNCFSSGKVTLIHDAIDVQKFAYQEELRSSTRKHLGLDNQWVIGHIGRFVHQKNHDFLLDIFAEIHLQDSNSVLVLVGDGELFNHIREKVLHLGLEDYVFFLGVRQDIPKLLQAMDIFLFPSHYEGFGMAAAEAQAAGLPTLVADTLPQEVKLTDLLEFFGLSQSASKWANKAFEVRHSHAGTRKAANIPSIYEISKAAKILENRYLILGSIR